jgi:hypothetical protein
MVASIIINNELVTSTSSVPSDNQGGRENPVFSEMYNELLAKAEPFAKTEPSAVKTESVEKAQASHYISKINPADVDAIYKAVKEEVKEELEAFNFDGKSVELFELHNSNIDKIMSYPVEVTIERDEINQAILYNSLGINYLDIKKIEVKMELLAKVKDEVIEQRKQGKIREDQAQLVIDRIETLQAQLMDKKEKLLEGNKNKESDEFFFEQLTELKNYNL